MDKITEGIVTVFTLIIGVAILSVLVSPKAKTAGVIQATASGFGNSLAVAEAPVTGANTPINLSYPSSGGMFGIGQGLPSFNTGAPGLY
jgi:hypothetical protein